MSSMIEINNERGQAIGVRGTLVFYSLSPVAGVDGKEPTCTCPRLCPRRALWRNRRYLMEARFIMALGPPGLWLYAWRPEVLRPLLHQHADVLRMNGWPVEPEAFVHQVRSTPVEPGTMLFDLIADAYGDTTNPGRTDVLPHVERERLLAALVPFVDPSFVYFEIFGRSAA